MMANANGQAGQALWRCAWGVAIGVWACVMAGSCVNQTMGTGPGSGGTVTLSDAAVENAYLQFDGVIGKISADNGSITVEHWPLTKTFKVPADCEIDISTNANATVAQLRVNDPVSIAYSEVGKELVANRIVRRGRAYEREQREKMERLNDMLYPSPNQ
ncbi:MAG TPA: hypothetical protein VMV72_09805 [Verrucomicrobiae bacterium]|nr:hypothetical protein [Verrucomicrobiae bacterium]